MLHLEAVCSKEKNNIMNKNFKTRILVVDDSAFMRQYLIGFLQEYGFVHIFEVGNGELALKKYDEVVPHVVLLDLIMPVTDGSSALEQLVGKGANVIVVSAMGQKKIMEKMLNKGAKAFFVKPYFTAQEIGKKIEEITPKDEPST